VNDINLHAHKNISISEFRLRGSKKKALNQSLEVMAKTDAIILFKYSKV